MTIQDRIIAYWKGRSADFGALRKKELTSDLAPRWLREIIPHIKVTNEFWTWEQVQVFLRFS